MRFAFIIVVCSALFVRADEIAAGRWEGSAQIRGREMNFVIDLAPAKDGWTGSIIIPGMGVKGGALSDIAINGADASFSIKTALADRRLGPAKFKGRVVDQKLSGDFMQGGHTAPFTLVKMGPPQVEQAPQNTAISKTLEGEWKGEYEIFGYPRKVTIKFQNRAADGATADFLIVGRKENHLPVDLVRQEADFVSVDSHETGLSFEGRVSGDEIKGTVTQGPLEIPVVMRRSK